MDNPLAGVMEWYQGLPQAAKIGIPVVGVGAVFLIAKSKGSGGAGSLITGPFGSSSGGGGTSGGGTSSGGTSGGGTGSGGTSGGGTSGGGTGGGNPKPKPAPNPQPKPKPKPAPGHGYGTHPGSKPIRKPVPTTKPKKEGTGGKAPPLHHLPSGHIHQALDGPKPHLAASHIADRSAVTAAANHPSSGVYGPAQAKESWTHSAAVTNMQHKTTTSKVTPSASHHPVTHKLSNTVPASKAHQYTNDKNRVAATTLSKKRGIGAKQAL